MKIKILGTRGEIQPSAPYHAKKSGVLLDDTILLDCGESSFLEYKPAYILITHLHPDHAYFVRHGERPKLQAHVYAPEGYDDMTITVAHEPFTIAGYRITPLPTVHSIKVKSQAYLIEHGDKKILYTGDMIWIDKQYQELLPQLDAVITEASFLRTGGTVRRDQASGAIFGHTGIPTLVHLFKKFTSKIILVHFGSWFYADIQKSRAELATLARDNHIDILVGYDGCQIDL